MFDASLGARVEGSDEKDIKRQAEMIIKSWDSRARYSGYHTVTVYAPTDEEARLIVAEVKRTRPDVKVVAA